MTGGEDSRSNSRKWSDTDIEALKKQEKHYREQLAELQRSRPRSGEGNIKEENLVAEITRLESEIVLLKDDLAATKTSLKDSRGQLKHSQAKAEEFEGKVDKVQSIIDEASTRIEQLDKIIARAVDTIFADFCKNIGCRNIRAYEDVRDAQNQTQGEEILRTNTAVQRFRNMYVILRLEDIADIPRG